jgi:polyisoprenyl-phosphate glycosyltransferase
LIRLNIVVPCFNEEDVLPLTSGKLLDTLCSLQQDGIVSPESHITFVDDGSRDRTWEMIRRLSAKTPEHIRGLKLSRNRGHQNALLAGLYNSSADATITIDADLQDDISVIPDMIRLYDLGFEIVYGVRSDRTADTPLKRLTASAYYKLLHALGIESIPQHADFRLMGRRAVEALKRYPETNLYLRALIPQLGFRSTSVAYARMSRSAGTSKYSLARMISLALNGITSFSIRPLRWIAVTGLLTSFASFALGIWAITVYIKGQTVPGWTSIVTPIVFLIGLQIFLLGIIGEYIGKIYLEVKRRPLYEVEETCGPEPEEPPRSPPQQIR